jgi:hypothetical protein
MKPSTIKKALKATLAITGFLLTTATLSIASTVLTANKASAELITSRGFGVSLNTNYNYRRIYGEPRMSVYATNPNDGDQQFDRIAGNAGWMLKHRGTGKCLNAYSKYSGAEPFVWACNPADMDQNWEMLDKGNGYVLYRLKNTGMCLTADTPVGNSSIVALRDCAYNGANGTQDWIGSLNPNSPVYSAPAQPPLLIRTGGSGAVNNSAPNLGIPYQPPVTDFKGEQRAIGNGQWVYGGLQTVEFCNGNGGINIRNVSAKFIASPPIAVTKVEFKIYSRVSFGFGQSGLFSLYTGTERWENLRGSVYKNSNQPWIYTNDPLWAPVQSQIYSTPVKFSTWVYLSNGQTHYDVGGIIDLGNIPPGECRTYDRNLQ